MSHYIGQRLSLKDELCTVRYFGPVAEKSGEWLGVEWDDPARGKHDGSHNGTRYFECRSSSSRVASFLNPNQSWDRPRTFLQALREKYMTDVHSTATETVYFSSKQAEQVGFDKFALRQKHLHGIHAVVLDHMRIQVVKSRDESAEIAELCGHVTDLDLSYNLFESFESILSLVVQLPKLQSLTLDGNRLAHPNAATFNQFPGLKTLSLSSTFLTWKEIAVIANTFPKLSNLVATQNSLKTLDPEPLPGLIQQIVLSDNSFTSLSSLRGLSACLTLNRLILRRCSISIVWLQHQTKDASCLSYTIDSLDLRDNGILSWAFFNSLQLACPQLRHLQASGNPLYQDLKSADGKVLGPEDGYILTLARMPQLQTLNYSKITEKERLNAETYYLNQIGVMLSQTPTAQHGAILEQHPRWSTLCDEYGVPSVHHSSKGDDIEPNKLSARLVRTSFTVVANSAQGPPRHSWSQEIPKSSSIYALQGTVAKKLGVVPFSLRLVCETNEDDPRQQEATYDGPEWWDSSDDEDDMPTQRQDRIYGEVELVPGTRAVGTYIEGREARIRVEIRDI